MAKEQPDYVSYLLRLWRASDGEGAAWRASLESPHTGERRGFASLDELFGFLRQQTAVSPDASGDRGQTRE
jgi:hypothetical protein